MIFSRIHMNKRVLRRALDEVIPGEWFVPAYSLAPAPKGTKGGGAFVVFKDAKTAMKACLVVEVTSSVEVDDEHNRRRALYGRMSEYYPWEDYPNRELGHDGYLIIRDDDTVETATFVPLGRQLTFVELCKVLGSRARNLGGVRIQGTRGELYCGDDGLSYMNTPLDRPENELGSRIGKFGIWSVERSFRVEGFAPTRLHGTVVITIGRAR